MDVRADVDIEGEADAKPSWADLVRRHDARLRRWARRAVPTQDAAEDLVQETWLAALVAWERFRGDSLSSTWLYAIFRRKLIDHLRRRSRSLHRLVAPPREEARFDERLDARTALVRLQGTRLSERDSILFERCLLREEPPRDVARDLGIRPATLRVALSRLRQRMRHVLAEAA